MVRSIAIFCFYLVEEYVYTIFINSFIVCDPVLGDNGKLYVPQSLIPIYREEIIPLSDICTPNQFEAELLSETKIKTEVDAWNALNWFHEKGVKTVVLSSTNISDEKHLKGFLSHKNGNDSIRFKPLFFFFFNFNLLKLQVTILLNTQYKFRLLAMESFSLVLVIYLRQYF